MEILNVLFLLTEFDDMEEDDPSLSSGDEPPDEPLEDDEPAAL